MVFWSSVAGQEVPAARTKAQPCHQGSRLPALSSSVCDIRSCDHNMTTTPPGISSVKKKGEGLEPKNGGWLSPTLVKTFPGISWQQLLSTFHWLEIANRIPSCKGFWEGSILASQILFQSKTREKQMINGCLGCLISIE